MDSNYVPPQVYYERPQGQGFQHIPPPPRSNRRTEQRYRTFGEYSNHSDSNIGAYYGPPGAWPHSPQDRAPPHGTVLQPRDQNNRPEIPMRRVNSLDEKKPHEQSTDSDDELRRTQRKAKKKNGHSRGRSSGRRSDSNSNISVGSAPQQQRPYQPHMGEIQMRQQGPRQRYHHHRLSAPDLEHYTPLNTRHGQGSSPRNEGHYQRYQDHQRQRWEIDQMGTPPFYQDVYYSNQYLPQRNPPPQQPQGYFNNPHVPMYNPPGPPSTGYVPPDPSAFQHPYGPYNEPDFRPAPMKPPRNNAPPAEPARVPPAHDPGHLSNPDTSDSSYFSHESYSSPTPQVEKSQHGTDQAQNYHGNVMRHAQDINYAQHLGYRVDEQRQPPPVHKQDASDIYAVPFKPQQETQPAFAHSKHPLAPINHPVSPLLHPQSPTQYPVSPTQLSPGEKGPEYKRQSSYDAYIPNRDFDTREDDDKWERERALQRSQQFINSPTSPKSPKWENKPNISTNSPVQPKSQGFGFKGQERVDLPIHHYRQRSVSIEDYKAPLIMPHRDKSTGPTSPYKPPYDNHFRPLNTESSELGLFYQTQPQIEEDFKPIIDGYRDYKERNRRQKQQPSKSDGDDNELMRKFTRIRKVDDNNTEIALSMGIKEEKYGGETKSVWSEFKKKEKRERSVSDAHPELIDKLTKVKTALEKRTDQDDDEIPDPILEEAKLKAKSINEPKPEWMGFKSKLKPVSSPYKDELEESAEEEMVNKIPETKASEIKLERGRSRSAFSSVQPSRSIQSIPTIKTERNDKPISRSLIRERDRSPIGPRINARNYQETARSKNEKPRTETTTHTKVVISPKTQTELNKKEAPKISIVRREPSPVRKPDPNSNLILHKIGNTQVWPKTGEIKEQKRTQEVKRSSSVSPSVNTKLNQTSSSTTVLPKVKYVIPRPNSPPRSDPKVGISSSPRASPKPRQTPAQPTIAEPSNNQPIKTQGRLQTVKPSQEPQSPFLSVPKRKDEDFMDSDTEFDAILKYNEAYDPKKRREKAWAENPVFNGTNIISSTESATFTINMTGSSKTTQCIQPTSSHQPASSSTTRSEFQSQVQKPSSLNVQETVITNNAFSNSSPLTRRRVINITPQSQSAPGTPEKDASIAKGLAREELTKGLSNLMMRPTQPVPVQSFIISKQENQSTFQPKQESQSTYQPKPISHVPNSQPQPYVSKPPMSPALKPASQYSKPLAPRSAFSPVQPSTVAPLKPPRMRPADASAADDSDHEIPSVDITKIKENLFQPKEGTSGSRSTEDLREWNQDLKDKVPRIRDNMFGKVPQEDIKNFLTPLRKSTSTPTIEPYADAPVHCVSETHERKKSQINDIITELENIYNDLDLDNERIIDGAERRDYPPISPRHGDHNDSKGLSETLLRNHDRLRKDTSSPQASFEYTKSWLANENHSFSKVQNDNVFHGKDSASETYEGPSYSPRPLSYSSTSDVHRHVPLRRSAVPNKLKDDVAYRKHRSKSAPNKPLVEVATMSYLSCSPALTPAASMDSISHRSLQRSHSHAPDILSDDVSYRQMKRSLSSTSLDAPEDVKAQPSPTTADYLLHRYQPRRRMLLRPERKADIQHDDYAYRSLRKDVSANKPEPLPAYGVRPDSKLAQNMGWINVETQTSQNSLNKYTDDEDDFFRTRAVPVRRNSLSRGMAQMVDRFENQRGLQHSASAPDLTQAMVLSVGFNSLGNIVSDDPRYERSAVKPRAKKETPRTIKQRAKQRQNNAKYMQMATEQAHNNSVEGQRYQTDTVKVTQASLPRLNLAADSAMSEYRVVLPDDSDEEDNYDEEISEEHFDLVRKEEIK
ncbi:unnamed protein product, partial [Owenia fusiformis]